MNWFFKTYKNIKISSESDDLTLEETQEKYIQHISNLYSIAENSIDGLIVDKDIPNIDSIASTLDNYYILPNIRQVPISNFNINGRHYSVQGNKRIKQLEQEISMNKYIKPLIVVIDHEGQYILEGSTRIDALYNLGIKFFPALVVIDLNHINI